MGGKDCPKFEKSKANPLPRSMDTVSSGRTRRMRHSLQQDLDRLAGLMNHVHLDDPVQWDYITIGHRGSHHRCKGLNRRSSDREHDQTDASQEEAEIDIQQETQMGKLDGHCGRGLRHGRHQLNGKGRKGALREILLGRSKHGAMHRRRVAHHLRRVHHHHHKHKEAAADIETLHAALREEINQPRKREHGHRGSAYQGHHHQRIGDTEPSRNSDNTSKKLEDHPQLNARQLNATRLAYIHRHHHHHRKPRNLRARFYNMPGRRGNRYHFTIPVPLATSASFSEWPTYDNESFVRTNYYHDPSELLNDVRRRTILIGGQVAAIHKRHRRSMHGHHHM